MNTAASSSFFAYCGMHYTTCPVEVREFFAKHLQNGDDSRILKDVFEKCTGSALEIVPISTCNRFDVCIIGSVTKENLLDAFASLVSMSRPDLEKFMRVAFDDDAVRMLFRIAGSLDSLVLGEPHILGQLKESFADAVSNSLCGSEATAVFNRCFQVAKRVRTETALGSRGTSVGHAAVELARRVNSDMSTCNILVVGAGEMGRIASQHFLDCGAQHLFLANRTFARAQDLAASEEKCTALTLESALHDASRFDIIVTATASIDFIVKPEHFLEFSRKRSGKTIVVVDISVPRNVDPALGKLDNLFLFDVDDLDKIMSENRTARSAAAIEAEKIIDEEVRLFSSLRRQRESLLYVGRFHSWARGIVESELRRSLKDKAPDLDTGVIADAVAKKLVSSPAALAKAGVRLDGSTIGDALQQMFLLPPLKKNGKDSP